MESNGTDIKNPHKTVKKLIPIILGLIFLVVFSYKYIRNNYRHILGFYSVSLLENILSVLFYVIFFVLLFHLFNRLVSLLFDRDKSLKDKYFSYRTYYFGIIMLFWFVVLLPIGIIKMIILFSLLCIIMLLTFLGEKYDFGKLF